MDLFGDSESGVQHLLPAARLEFSSGLPAEVDGDGSGDGAEAGSCGGCCCSCCGAAGGGTAGGSLLSLNT